MNCNGVLVADGAVGDHRFGVGGSGALGLGLLGRGLGLLQLGLKALGVPGLQPPQSEQADQQRRRARGGPNFPLGDQSDHVATPKGSELLEAIQSKARASTVCTRRSQPMPNTSKWASRR